jgi:CBS-domain-containing membrane protein
MADIQVRRLPVLNRDKRLIGIVSVGDMSLHVKPAETGQALRGISRPGGQHDQSAEGERAPAGVA